MLSHENRQQIQDIVSGKIIESQDDPCREIRNYLCSSFGSSRLSKKDFESKRLIKEKQVESLKDFANQRQLLIDAIDPSWLYITRGGESEIYLIETEEAVRKVNDAVYYATWLEFWDSIVLHNIFFPDTAYEFAGFLEKGGTFNAVLKQRFVKLDQTANLEDIEDHLAFNGFIKTKRQDYYHPELKIILEDMHDENVLMKENILFFIDTVFYIS